MLSAAPSEPNTAEEHIVPRDTMQGGVHEHEEPVDADGEALETVAKHGRAEKGTEAPDMAEAKTKGKASEVAEVEQRERTEPEAEADMEETEPTRAESEDVEAEPKEPGLGAEQAGQRPSLAERLQQATHAPARTDGDTTAQVHGAQDGADTPDVCGSIGATSDGSASESESHVPDLWLKGPDVSCESHDSRPRVSPAFAPSDAARSPPSLAVSPPLDPTPPPLPVRSASRDKLAPRSVSDALPPPPPLPARRKPPPLPQRTPSTMPEDRRAVSEAPAQSSGRAVRPQRTLSDIMREADEILQEWK